MANSKIPRLERKRYDPVGCCIYCGASEGLSDEHIMPFGLGGNLVLPDASCRPCAAITGRVEGTVLRGQLRPLRVLRRIQSRSGHGDAPEEIPLRVRRGTEWETVLLPHDRHPLMVHFPLFAPPGCIASDYRGGLHITGLATHNFGADPDAVLRELAGDEIRATEDQSPAAFARMTAKVAYGLAVAQRGIDPTEGRPEVVRSILGELDEIGRWVGTLAGPDNKLEDVLHLITLHADGDKGLLIGRVQYFSDASTPNYGVVLGELASPFVLVR